MELSIFLANIMAILAAILGLILAGWWIIGLYGVHTREEEKELEEEKLPAHLYEKVYGIPPVLWTFYLALLIISIAYIYYIWTGGVSY